VLDRAGFVTGPAGRRKFGGGGRNRTYDAAEMSRADTDTNLLELLTEMLLELSAGDIQDA